MNESKNQPPPYQSTPPAPVFKAEFHPLVRAYLFLYAIVMMFASVVGIVLIPVWILGLGQWWSGRYYRRLECVLRPRELFFRRGLLIHSQSTIPLDRITDLTVTEGPLLRALGLSNLRVETPGTSGQGRAGGITLIGIVNTPEFRDRVLAQRDLLAASPAPSAEPSAPGSPAAVELLRTLVQVTTEIRDRLRDRTDAPTGQG